jgi:DNA-binding response OmpR family regulator
VIADDDKEIVQLIAEGLEDEAFSVIKCFHGPEVISYLNNRQNPIDLIILDIMMPGMNGLEVCRNIRSMTSVPIMFLSAKTRDLDKVLGLEVGADDYLTKPFSMDELVARVKAHLRRDQRQQSAASSGLGSGSGSIIEFAQIKISKQTMEVWKDGLIVELSTKEFQLLSYLAEHRNQVLRREQIYDAVWGQHEYGDLNTVTVHIKNIRKKLDPDNRYIVTVWGVGYQFRGGTAVT